MGGWSLDDEYHPISPVAEEIERVNRMRRLRTYRRASDKPARKQGKSKSAAYKRRKKRKILKRDGHKCVYCEKALTVETMTLDHYVPKSKGGANSIKNPSTKRNWARVLQMSDEPGARMNFVPVAQLDRAREFYSRICGFDSYRGCLEILMAETGREFYG